ncbi:MAG: ROK family protein [Chloroflexota bacterium]
MSAHTSGIRTGAVDLGGTTIKIGILEGNRILEKREIPAQSSGQLAGRLETIALALEAMAEGDKPLSGVAFSFPGIVDPVRRRVISSNNKFQDATRLDLSTWARERLDLPFLMENDANAALIGECRKGCGRGIANAVLFILGTGVGTAALMDGRLVRGAHFQAGILGGHFKTAFNEAACSCGSPGCLEAAVGSWAVPRLSAGRFLAYRELLDACRQKDREARELLDGALTQWARGIATLIHAYDPDVVILSGGVMKGHDVFLEELKVRVRERIWAPWGGPAFLIAEYPDQSVLLGLHALLEETQS